VVERSRDGIVEDGRDRLIREERHEERECEVREAVRDKYRPRLAQARGLGWLLAYMRMRRELREELEALAPRRGWYLRES
jgi:hypothetical protein